MIYWTSTNLLECNWFWFNQTRMVLERYQNLLELPVKKLVIELSLASSISVGQCVWCWKNKMLMLFVAKFRYFFVTSKSCPSLAWIYFRLKGSIKSKTLSKRVAQVILWQLFQEIFIKIKNVVLSGLSFQGNSMIYPGTTYRRYSICITAGDSSYGI